MTTSTKRSATDDKQAKIAAAIAAQKPGKAAQQADTSDATSDDSAPSDSAADDKQAKIAAAIEKAKARKAIQQGKTQE